MSERDEDLLGRVVAAARGERAEDGSPPTLGADAHERMAAAILASPSPARRPIAPPAAPPRSNLRALTFAALPLVAAAAILLLVLRPSRSIGEALPDYTVTVQGASETRGAPAPVGQVAHLYPTSTLDLIARPASAVPGAVAARAVLVQGGVARPWSAPIEVAEGGVARIHGRADALLPGPTGSWEIVLALGRADSVPSEGELAAIATNARPAPEGGAVRIVRAKVSVAPGP